MSVASFFGLSSLLVFLYSALPITKATRLPAAPATSALYSLCGVAGRASCAFTAAQQPGRSATMPPKKGPAY